MSVVPVRVYDELAVGLTGGCGTRTRESGPPGICPSEIAPEGAFTRVVKCNRHHKPARICRISHQGLNGQIFGRPNGCSGTNHSMTFFHCYPPRSVERSMSVRLHRKRTKPLQRRHPERVVTVKVTPGSFVGRVRQMIEVMSRSRGSMDYV